jgi:hypothetical protein
LKEKAKTFFPNSDLAKQNFVLLKIFLFLRGRGAARGFGSTHCKLKDRGSGWVGGLENTTLPIRII